MKAVIWQVGGGSQMSSARAAWTQQLSCVSTIKILLKKKKSLFSAVPVPTYESYTLQPQSSGTSHPVAGPLGEEV